MFPFLVVSGRWGGGGKKRDPGNEVGKIREEQNFPTLMAKVVGLGL